MEGLTTIQKLAVFALPVLLAITVHEAAHGWVAKLLGDRTAYMLGRVTVNPLKHIDLVGTIIVPTAMFLLSGFLFGWAKPVPINGRNLGNPRRDMALVALAGPGANFLMALFWAGISKLGTLLGETLPWVAIFMVLVGAAGIFINAILMVLNLLPILPLDGGRVVASLLPVKIARIYTRSEPWGLMIVVALVVTGLLRTFIEPGVGFVHLLATWMFGLG